MANDMSEPISTGAAGAIGWKALGGAAGALGIGAAMASIVVMAMTLPKSVREWTVGLISTVIGSLAGGAYVITRFDLLAGIYGGNDVGTLLKLCSVLGVAFACGLPAWALVRAVFLYIERNKDRDALQIVEDVKAKI